MTERGDHPAFGEDFKAKKAFEEILEFNGLGPPPEATPATNAFTAAEIQEMRDAAEQHQEDYRDTSG